MTDYISPRLDLGHSSLGRNILLLISLEFLWILLDGWLVDALTKHLFSHFPIFVRLALEEFDHLHI